FFANSHSNLISLNFGFLAAFYGWAVYRFRLRFWLVMAILSTHYSVAFYLDRFGLWQNAEQAWLRFLPLTVIMLVIGLIIEKQQKEDSPLHTERLFRGWSRPFYLFVFFDILFAQLGSWNGTFAGAEVSLVHMLLVAVLASAWASAELTYLSLFLGLSALLQWRAAEQVSNVTLPVHLAGLA